jgi:hypothetical protein
MKYRRKDRSEWKTRIRRKQLLDELKETIGYWQLKEEALDRSLRGTGFRMDYGPVIRQTTYNTSFRFIICRVETDVVNVTLPFL